MKKFMGTNKGILLAGTSLVAALVAMPAIAQDNQESDSGELEEIVVTGIRGSLESAAAIKRNADQMVDAISAEDIGLFSDNNIGEALQRIPGILLAREAGEGYQITIRGLGPRFVRTTINGRTALSNSGDENASGADSRAFSFNSIPSEVISAVRVGKSTLARDIEGGIAGTVDMQTNRALNFANKRDQDFFISGALRASYNDLTSDLAPRGSIFINKKVSDSVAFFLAVTIDDATRQDNTTESQNMRTRRIGNLRAGSLLNGEVLTEDLARDDYAMFSGVRNVNQAIIRDRQTFTGGLQWQTGGFDVNLDWTHGREQERREDQRYWQRLDDVTRGRAGTILSFDVDYGDATTDVGVPSAGTITGFSWEGGNRNVLANSLYRRIFRNTNSNVGGLNVEWADDVWTISADVGYADVSGVRTLDRLRGRTDLSNPLYGNAVGGTYTINSEIAVANLTDINGDAISPDDTSNQAFNLLEKSHIFQDARDISSRLDFTRDISSGDLLDTMFFGVAVNETLIQRNKTIKGVSSGFDFDGVENSVTTGLFTDITAEGFMNSFAIPSIYDARWQEYLDDPTGLEIEQDDTFDVKEAVIAGYLQFAFSGKEDVGFRGNLGVRFVNTKQTSTGFVGSGEGASFVPADPNNPIVSASRSYTNVLPSFNIAFDVREDMVLRFAANKAVTRPDPVDLAGRLDLGDLDDIDNVTGSGGNPDLEAYGTFSIDAALEWYPEIGGSYALGLFHKKMDGWISRGSEEELVVITGNPDAPVGVDSVLATIRRPVNTDGGTIKGFEFAFHTPFDFAPGILQYFGLNGSLTYVDAQIDAVVPERGVPISLRGTSKWSGTIIGYYEKDRFSARLAYDYRTDYLHQEASANDRFDEVTRGSGNWDANMSYNIRKGIRARVSVSNLTNTKRARYWDTPGQYMADLRENGRSIVFELRFKY